MEVIFLSLYRFFNSRRFLFLAFVVLVVLVGLYYASKMNLEEDISKSMPGENDQIALGDQQFKTDQQADHPGFFA